jgi:hypothetical protein
MEHSDIVLREWESLEALLCGTDSTTVVLSGHTLRIPDVIAVSRFVADHVSSIRLSN